MDLESEKVVHFTHASNGYEFLIDQLLKKDMGLTFDVFKDDVDDEGKVIEKDDPAHVLVPEVVREPRIHFFQVPRLGSYLAIRLEYNSCLLVDSYNEGIKDYTSMKQRLAD